MVHPFPAARTGVPRSLVQAELDRILASELFSRSDRLSAFLRFIVEATLKGDGAGLKEHVIAMELYGKGADFSTGADPIVRVDARRLRDKLREYYATAPRGAVVISVPKGSYTPLFELGDPTTAGPAPQQSEHLRVVERELPAAVAPPATARGMAVAALALVLVGACAWLIVSRQRSATESVSRLLTVTSFPGVEDDPWLSPDGNFVVFSWGQPNAVDLEDLWVKEVEGDSLRRLTETPGAREKWPSWSPDGREIAFTRRERGGPPRIYTISALGGSERMIGDGEMASWTPDSRGLVIVSTDKQRISAVVRYDLETGDRRQLTTAPAGFADRHPRVSPDGKWVAFNRFGAGRSAILRVPLDGGEVLMVGEWVTGVVAGLTWTPDGREVLYARPGTSGRRIVRVATDSGQPVDVPGLPFGSTGPSASRARNGQANRLAFVTGQVDIGLRLVDLAGPPDGKTTLDDVPFADATRMDLPGRFSPDGAEVAFVSDRGGSQQVWIAGRNGSALRSVTRLNDATVNVGSWSPDGQWVAFDASIAGNTDIYVVRRDGGASRRLTTAPAIEIDPEWSRDGQWMYYSSDQAGSHSLWKMPVNGGGATRLTSEAGFEPRQSPDGRHIYFVDQRRAFGRIPATLKQVSSQGGPVTVVHSGLGAGAWDVTDAGVVYVAARGTGPEGSAAPDVLAIRDFAGGVRVLGALNFLVAPSFANRFLATSRDGRWALATHVDKIERDIMLVDNFR